MTDILLIHQAFASPGEAGGTRHFEFARHCVAKGHQFTIVASDLNYLSGRRIVSQNGLVRKQNLDGVQVLRAYTYPSLHRNFLGRIVSFISFMITSLLAARRAGPADLVMGTSPPVFQALSAWLVAVVRRRPFLLEVRDLWLEFAIDSGLLRNPLLIALSRWLERFLFARAKQILINSPAYRESLLNKAIPEEKICLIPNGVDPEMFDPQAEGSDIRRDLGLNGKFVVTYAGALGLTNDIDTILRAAVRLRDESHIHFLLVGDGKERERLEKRSESLDLSNVTFTGALPKTAVRDILAASDACVATLRDMPMLRTTYPNKVFDYMAAGRPTILAIDGVIRKVVEAAGGGLCVPPGDEEALAAAARFLCRNSAQAQAMGRAARAYVTKNFNRRLQAVAFEQLVQRLVESH